MAAQANQRSQDNANIEGIGFADENVGWAGGWGDEGFQAGFTSETRDGGDTWTDANHVGKFLNRFRFIHEPEFVGYASGDTVYKYAPAAPSEPSLVGPPQPDEILRSGLPVHVPVQAPAGTELVRVDVFDRFGEHLATPMYEERPEPGEREIAWSGETRSGGSAGDGIYLIRVTVDDDAESHAVVIRG